MYINKICELVTITICGYKKYKAIGKKNNHHTVEFFDYHKLSANKKELSKTVVTEVQDLEYTETITKNYRYK